MTQILSLIFITSIVVYAIRYGTKSGYPHLDDIDADEDKHND
jgi:hypothetical protein